MKIKQFINEMVTSAATGTDSFVFQRLFTTRPAAIQKFFEYAKKKKKKHLPK